jgi:hypothetical protein
LTSLAPPPRAPIPNQSQGIYVSDILDAVPIDKYFELFRPGAGGDGGFIRLSLDYGTEPPQHGYNGYGGGKKKRG